MAYDALVTLPQVKQWLNYNDTATDGALAWLIQASSDLIARFCDRDNLAAVITYDEFYFQTAFRKSMVVLNHYPVVSITALLLNGTAQKILTNPNAGPGVFLHNDRRTLLMIGGLMPSSSDSSNIQAQYTAGYARADIPAGLQQACIQHIGEIAKSQAWIGYRSKSLAGETVSFDTGAVMSMSPRTLAMLRPYRNVVPLAGVAC